MPWRLANAVAFMYANNLGAVFQELGDLPGARERFEQALAIDLAAFGDNHPNVAIRANNLGSVLQDQGDLEGARKRFEQALAIDRATFGDNHPNVAFWMPTTWASS